jgi:phage terminase large subunit
LLRLPASFSPLLDPARYKAVRALGVSDQFRILHDRIITPGGGTINFVGLATHTIESLKSYEGVNICWCEESALISERSLDILLPTRSASGI